MNKARKEPLGSIAHFAASAVILLHAFATADEHPLAFMLYPALAVVVLVVAFTHRHVGQRWLYLPVVFHFIAAVATALVLNDDLHLGRKYMVYVDAAVISLCVAVGIMQMTTIARGGDHRA